MLAHVSGYFQMVSVWLPLYNLWIIYTPLQSRARSSYSGSQGGARSFQQDLNTSNEHVSGTIANLAAWFFVWCGLQSMIYLPGLGLGRQLLMSTKFRGQKIVMVPLLAFPISDLWKNGLTIVMVFGGTRELEQHILTKDAIVVFHSPVPSQAMAEAAALLSKALSLALPQLFHHFFPCQVK